jgi:hypothetical protein
MECGLILTSSNLCARPVFCLFRSHCRRCRAQLLCARISLVSCPRRPTSRHGEGPPRSHILVHIRRNLEFVECAAKFACRA